MKIVGISYVVVQAIGLLGFVFGLVQSLVLALLPTIILLAILLVGLLATVVLNFVLDYDDGDEFWLGGDDEKESHDKN